MGIVITKYSAVCNLGFDVETIFHNAINGNNSAFEVDSEILRGKKIRIGKIKGDLPTISDEKFNTRCNRLILKNLEPMKECINSLIEKYGKDEIGVVVATTNSGVEEFEATQNIEHTKLSNPALFIKEYLGVDGYFASVSTACSSGIKAFSLARNLLNSNFLKSVIVIGADPISKVPLYGFSSLEILSPNPTNPFSKNRNGINIGEATSIFILEKDEKGIEILGIGESSDTYNLTTPNPDADEIKLAISKALDEAKLSPNDIDYINLHGTGTIANDLAESKAIFDIFADMVPSSSTKPLTGHCLGAAASIETALCCALLEKFENKIYPHIFDNEYDENISKIKLVNKEDNFRKCNVCMCNSFGFGGTNAILILRKNYE